MNCILHVWRLYFSFYFPLQYQLRNFKGKKRKLGTLVLGAENELVKPNVHFMGASIFSCLPLFLSLSLSIDEVKRPQMKENPCLEGHKGCNPVPEKAFPSLLRTPPALWLVGGCLVVFSAWRALFFLYTLINSVLVPSLHHLSHGSRQLMHRDRRTMSLSPGFQDRFQNFCLLRTLLGL